MWNGIKIWKINSANCIELMAKRTISFTDFINALNDIFAGSLLCICNWSCFHELWKIKQYVSKEVVNTSAFAESGSSGCFTGCPTKGYNHFADFVWRYCYLNPWRPSICIVKFMNMHPINNSVYSVICCGLIWKSVNISSGISIFQEGWQRKCRPSVATLS